MNTLTNLPIFSLKLTKREKAEYLLIITAGALMAFIGVYTFNPAFAEMTSGDLASMVKLIIKVICFIVGALFSIIGVVKFAISHANEDGPAQQKAIMMMATGVLLVILGVALPALIQDSWFEVST